MAKTQSRTTVPATSKQTWRPRRTPVAPPPSRGAKAGALVKGKAGSLAGGLAVTAATAVGGAVFRKVKARRGTKDAQPLIEPTSMGTAPSASAVPGAPTVPTMPTVPTVPTMPTMPDGASYGGVVE